MLRLFKEQFNGKYDGVTPATLLPVGSLSDGANVRKVSPLGGWKVRKGCKLHNTTALESGAAVKSLHQFTHPRLSDAHFIAQVNSKLLDSPVDPPTAAGGSGWTTLEGSNVGTTPGFSAVMGETFVYADGTAAPIVYGGDYAYCSGFLSYDNSSTTYTDYLRLVTDNRTGTEAICVAAASDKIYVCSPEIAEEIKLDLGTTVNTTSSRTLTLKSWQSTAWSDRSAADGTKSGTTTMAQDGSITWTRSASDKMRVLEGIMGYWYEISFSDALSNSVDVISCQVKYDATTISNKWDGVPHHVAGCLFFDNGDGEYHEALGQVSNESTSQYLSIDDSTTSDYLYIKTSQPATGFGIGMVKGFTTNSGTGNTDAIDHWDGDSWATANGIIDTTLDSGGAQSFSQSGWLFWDATRDSPKRSTLEGDPIPGYWYRLSWDATLATSDDDIRIYQITYAPFPEAMAAVDGVIEFKERLLAWGDSEFPNRLRYSAYRKHDCFSGSDSGYTDAFGDMKKIKCCVVFYNELIVFKEDSVWMLEGYGPGTFGKARIASTVGLASPQTAKVVEAGYPGMHQDEPMSIAIWQDTDGIYVLDGRKPKKISAPVDNYFNTEYTTAIVAASIANRQAFVDPLNNEYHFLLPAGELVYNYVTEEWFPPWARELSLDCGLRFKDTNKQDASYGATAAGWICRLENDTTDKNTSNADVAISHSVKTRAIAVEQKQSTTLRFDFRRIQIEAKARTAGSVTTKTFKDMATSGTTQAVPETISLVNSGFNLTVDSLDVSVKDCVAMQVEFSNSTADEEIEIYSMVYAVETRGEVGVK